MKYIANQEKLTLPTGITTDQIAMRDKLIALSGAEFDKAFMSDMVKDLDDTKQEFEAHSTTGDNDEVKRFAARLIGALTQDLTIAREAAAKVGAK
jgi:putative membrane protein